MSSKCSHCLHEFSTPGTLARHVKAQVCLKKGVKRKRKARNSSFRHLTPAMLNPARYTITSADKILIECIKGKNKYGPAGEIMLDKWGEVNFAVYGTRDKIGVTNKTTSNYQAYVRYTVIIGRSGTGGTHKIEKKDEEDIKILKAVNEENEYGLAGEVSVGKWRDISFFVYGERLVRKARERYRYLRGLDQNHATIIRLNAAIGKLASLGKSSKKKRKMSIGGVEIQPQLLLAAVKKFGGVDTVRKKQLWSNKVRTTLNLTKSNNVANRLNNCYDKYLDGGYFEEEETEKTSSSSSSSSSKKKSPSLSSSSKKKSPSLSSSKKKSPSSSSSSSSSTLVVPKRKGSNKTVSSSSSSSTSNSSTSNSSTSSNSSNKKPKFNNYEQLVLSSSDSGDDDSEGDN